MTKKEMARAIAERLDLPVHIVSATIQMVFDDIVETLVTEGRIELRNFGVFEVKQRKARRGRNPRNGAPVLIPPKRVVTFKAGEKMIHEVWEPAKVMHVYEVGGPAQLPESAEGVG